MELKSLFKLSTTHWRLMIVSLFVMFAVNSLIFARDEYSLLPNLPAPQSSSEIVEAKANSSDTLDKLNSNIVTITGSDKSVDYISGITALFSSNESQGIIVKPAEGNVSKDEEFKLQVRSKLFTKSYSETVNIVRDKNPVLENSKVLEAGNKSVDISEILFVEGEPREFTESMKIILLWSTYEMKNNWWNTNTYGQEPFIKDKCPVNTCFLSNNKSHIKQADFVMFHYNEGPNWPAVRYPHQSYVHAMKERPIPRQTWLLEYENKINLTFNYRHDADIFFWPYTFPAHKERKSGPYRLRIPLKDKPYSIVWPVSHCPTASKREQYVKELSKYMDVHIYGRCGNYTCPKRPWYTCFEMFEKTYKFYISFENSICKDYISEKAQVPMHYELIPIVLGGGDYKNNVPPGSYLDARDFIHPRDLAKHLHRLATNEMSYARYFQWKQEYGVGGRFDRMCVLCQAAHDRSLVRPAHHDYYNWWHRVCDNDLVPRMRQQGGW